MLILLFRGRLLFASHVFYDANLTVELVCFIQMFDYLAWVINQKIFLGKGCIMTLKLSPMPDTIYSSLLFRADGGLFSYLFILFL